MENMKEQWNLVCPKCGVIATLPYQECKDDSWEWIDKFDEDAEWEMPTQCCTKCKSILDFEDATIFYSRIPKGLSYLEGLAYADEHNMEDV